MIKYSLFIILNIVLIKNYKFVNLRKIKMGCIKSFIDKQNNYTINDKKLKEGILTFDDIPDDQYLCPFCDEIPLILNIYSEFGYIEIKCRTYGECLYPIKAFFENCKKKSYFKSECCGFEHKELPKKNKKENIYIYCSICKKEFCEICKELGRVEGHNNNHEKYCIPANKKHIQCLQHVNSDINSYCEDCHENVCKEELETKHRNHKIIKFHNLTTNIEEHIKIIENKNKIFGDIIAFNNAILKSYENSKNNYYNNQSIINLGNQASPKNEKIEFIKCMYDNLAKNTEDSKEILKELKKKYELDKNIDEGKLIIKDNFDEKDLELISKLKNINFKEITLSGCGIEDISPLKYMNLSKLKKLDLSNNKIINIEVLKKIKCPQLIEINLNNNNISNFDSSIFKDHFPILEKLIIENKNFLQELEYSKEKFFKHNKESLARTAEELKEKYGVEIKEDLDLSNKLAGDIILQELLNICEDKIKIKTLNLRNNNIQDCSLLSKIYLNELEELDLSYNKIENLKFLSEMRMPNLEVIKLDNNSIKDILPLKEIKKLNKPEKGEKMLTTISLKNNNQIKYEDENTNYIIQFLKSKKIKI